MTVESRVIRGAPWICSIGICRSACRDAFRPDFYSDILGFRFVVGDEGAGRVLRGGATGLGAKFCRSAVRSLRLPEIHTRHGYISLRVVVSCT